MFRICQRLMRIHSLNNVLAGKLQLSTFTTQFNQGFLAILSNDVKQFKQILLSESFWQQIFQGFKRTPKTLLFKVFKYQST